MTGKIGLNYKINTYRNKNFYISQRFFIIF